MRYLVFFVIFISALSLSAQKSDSLNAIQDGVLNEGIEERNKMLFKADSSHLADSLEQVLLQRQIEELKNSDRRKKAELQARLDSLKKLQEQKEIIAKQRIDSLRANATGAPVVIFEDTLYFIFDKLGPFSPGERARSTKEKIESLVKSGNYSEDELHITSDPQSTELWHEETVLFSITKKDGFWLDKTPKTAVEEITATLKTSISNYQDRTGFIAMITRTGLFIVVLALFFFGVKYMNRGLRWLNIRMLQKVKPFLNGIKFKNYEFISSEREAQLLFGLLKALKWFLIAVIIYMALPILFSIFPATKGIAQTLFGYVLNPLKSFGMGLLGYLPELFTIIIIVVITRYAIRFLKFLASEVASGNLELPGFYADWSKPTFNLLKLLIYAFSFIIIFPYLPGSDSPVFQGVSVFLGLLISLGSSSAIGNIIAGLVITYMRSFKIGDRVKIGETVGDVVEKTMLVTRLKTIKNEYVSIPNSAILTGSTINYSNSATDLGLILNSTVTIGYDVPWRKVHQILIDAALGCSDVEKEPQPFVLQTSLDDFYVSYQINAHTKKAAIAAKIYSELHANIQDGFNEAQIEILSPHYRATRDGGDLTIPPEYHGPK